MIVTVLTGRRPDLLRRTLEGLVRFDVPGKVTVLHNDDGSDEETVAVIEEFGFEWISTRRYLPGAEATAVCGGIAVRSGYDFWLHVEDDWEATDDIRAPVEAAVWLLRNAPEVGQVRLRRRDDGAMATHYLDRHPIEWVPSAVDGVVVGRAHATWNPSVMRTVAAGNLLGVSGEVDFMVRMAEQWPLNGQADPGVFRHIGKGRSLMEGQR